MRPYVESTSNLDNLQQMVDSLDKQLSALTTKLQCDDIYSAYNETLDHACNSGVDMAFITLCLQAGVAFALFVMLPLLLCLCANTAKYADYDYSDDVAERRPLISVSWKWGRTRYGGRGSN